MTETANHAPERALDEGEAAALLGCCRATLARLRRAGDGPPHYMVGKRPRYVLHDVAAWRAARVRAGTEG
ncbi:helix-turn-helix transcriptional regulator [Neoroseomonas rubea]|uniref:helix-turn-helix transcriptional regulator n=1 Tax=Neoroseomonas rubea TaxID=2748666 RepID=UPI0018DFE1D0|nr:helix-turn-helix domain-containing protein [Roseomonas rubea]